MIKLYISSRAPNTKRGGYGSWFATRRDDSPHTEYVTFLGEIRSFIDCKNYPVLP